MKISVILPTYNEKGNIVQLIPELDKYLVASGFPDYEIIIVDDNSPDGTAQAVEELIPRYPGLKVYLRTTERGLASALRFGILKASGEIFLFMDSDFNHQPCDLPRLLGEINNYDIVIGSRYVKGGYMESSMIRHYLSLFFNLFVRTALGLRTTDNLSGFIATKKKVMDALDFTIFEGFGEYHIPFIYQATKVHLFSVHEVPVIYKERKYGESKFKAIDNLINYTKTVMRVRRQWRNNKVRLFDTQRREQCAVCGEKDSRGLYGYDGFEIRKCRGCGFVYLDPILTEEAVRKIYASPEALGEVFPICENYFEVYSAQEDNPTIRTFHRWLDVLGNRLKGREILDVGCGGGQFLGAARAKGWNIHGIDFHPALSAEKNEIAACITAGNFSAIAPREKSMDAVTMWDFLEHVSDPRAVLEKAARWLKDGGRLLVAVPKQNSLLELLAGILFRVSFGLIQYPVKVVYLLDHPSNFTQATLTLLLQKSGFTAETVRFEETDLSRVTLSPLMKFLVKIIFWAGRPFGLQNRMVIIAKKNDA